MRLPTLKITSFIFLLLFISPTVQLQAREKPVYVDVWEVKNKSNEELLDYIKIHHPNAYCFERTMPHFHQDRRYKVNVYEFVIISEWRGGIGHSKYCLLLEKIKNGAHSVEKILY